MQCKIALPPQDFLPVFRGERSFSAPSPPFSANSAFSGFALRPWRQFFVNFAVKSFYPATLRHTR